ncbi:helix-turn-helix transcriptional regulator [Maribacter sp. CXY002]|uniref:helix-turn-helix transcriptional regulator n=1 Tax=Maribacter luteocoastalis TaxID=3407671 RepID=UPI003B682722
MPNQFREKHKDSLLLKLDEIHAKFPKRLTIAAQSYFRKFHINRIKDFAPFAGAKQPPYRKSVSDFMVITKGKSIRSKGLNMYELTPMSVFFVPAYQIRTSEFISDDLDGFFCHFDMEIFHPSRFPHDNFSQFPFLQYVGNALVQVPEKSMPEILSLMELLHGEYQKESHSNFNVICSLLMTFFYKLNSFTAHTQKVKSRASILTQAYKDALMEHIYDIHSVKGYADYLRVSQNYLNRALKNTIGKTALAILTEMQLIEAKSLLRQSGLNISEIAFKLGNKNHSDFSRFFKKNTGITPGQFRDGEDHK